MGKVTPYQQGELASQLVGVPQQDNSALQIANAMTNSAGALGNAVSQANAQNQADMQNFQNQAMSDLKVEIGAHRAAKNYLDRQLAQANRDAKVSNLTTAATNEYSTLQDDIEKNFRNNPEKAMEALKNGHKSIQEKYLDMADDPLVRAKIIADTNNKFESHTTKTSSWVKTQETNNNINQAADNVDSTSATFKRTIAVGDTKTLGEKIDEFMKTNRDSYGNIYGANAIDKLNEARNRFVYDVLSVWSAAKPGSVRDIINSGQMGDFVPDKLLNQLVGLDDSNFNAARSITVAKLHETNANTSAQIRDIESIGAGLSKENIHQAPGLIRQLTEMYAVEQSKPVENRDKDLENQMLSAMWKIGGRNQTVKSAMGTELKENAMFEQARIQFERSEDSYQKSQNAEAIQKRQGSAEAINEAVDINSGIEDIKAKINLAGGIEKAIKSGVVNPVDFRNLQKRINAAGESQLFTPGKTIELNEKLDKYRTQLFPGEKQKAPLAGFIDAWLGKSLEGPSDRLMQMTHISERSGPRYLELKDRVDNEIEAIYKEEGIPQGAKFSPAQKDLLYQKASLRVWDKMTKDGTMQQILETTVDVKKKPPLMGPGDIKKQVEAKANKGSGKPVARPAPKKAYTTNRREAKGMGMVPPPPAIPIMFGTGGSADVTPTLSDRNYNDQ